MIGFVFPNEGVEWDLLITIYPFITGLVAGSFIVSSLYHLFGIKALKPVARFSLIASLAFLLVTPLPLTLHLGHPERAFEMFLTPHLTSAMSAFGYIWLVYLLIVLCEVWLIFRPDIIRNAISGRGWKKVVYPILALGVLDMSPKTEQMDHRIIKFLAGAGIPAAFLLHGYVGFIFGAVKANPWWSTPLMPIIFLISAVVSGMALLLVLYIAFTKIRKQPLDPACLRTLVLWLGAFLSISFILETLEVFTMLYESEEAWPIISQLLTQKLNVSYIGIQFMLGSLLPLLVLAIVAIANKARLVVKESLSFAAGILVVTGVFAMRWNVVIGGQLISKSLRGFLSYTPPLTGGGGIIESAGILLLPFLILIVLVKLLPPWDQEANVIQSSDRGTKIIEPEIQNAQAIELASLTAMRSVTQTIGGGDMSMVESNVRPGFHGPVFFGTAIAIPSFVVALISLFVFPNDYVSGIIFLTVCLLFIIGLAILAIGLAKRFFEARRKT